MHLCSSPPTAGSLETLVINWDDVKSSASAPVFSAVDGGVNTVRTVTTSDGTCPVVRGSPCPMQMPGQYAWEDAHVCVCVGACVCMGGGAVVPRQGKLLASPFF